MKLIDAIKTHGSMTAEQKKLLKEKQIDADMTPDAWITYLKDLAAFDSAADSVRGKLGCGGAIVLVLGVVVALFAEMWYLLVIAAVLAIPAIIGWFLLRSKDVPNNLRKFVLPMITLLREDMDPAQTLHLKLDLRDATTKDKRTSQQDLGNVNGRKIKEAYYENPWMMGDTTLVDGTSLDWEIRDNIRERTITKRNPRGKVKTKTKHKI